MYLNLILKMIDGKGHKIIIKNPNGSGYIIDEEKIK